jgi:flagellar biogenesis protein FliO
MKMADAWRLAFLALDVLVALLFILYCGWIKPKVIAARSRR